MTESVKKPRGRPRDAQKRDAILDAARTLFLAQGPEVTTDEVITLAGVAKATLYANFKDKEDLIEAVIRRESETIMAGDLTNLAGASFEKTIWDVGYRWVTFVNQTDVVGWERLISHGARRHPQLPQRFFDAGPGRWFALLTDLLESAAQAGKLPKLDSARAAEDLVGLWLGFSSLQLRLGGAGPISDAEVRRRVCHGLRIFSVAYGLHDQLPATESIPDCQPETVSLSYRMG